MPINLAGAQAAVERLLLVDTCTIRYGEDRAGGGATNYLTGVHTPPVKTVLYNGECYVSGNTFSVGAIYSEGGDRSEERKYTISIPKDTVADILPEDELVITAVHVGGDQELVGRVFVVEDVNAGTYSILRKIQCRFWQEKPDDA